MFEPFSIARLPRIEFGRGTIAKLPALVQRYGHRILLITGAGSIERAQQWQTLLQGLDAAGIQWHRVRISGEPSPERIDEIVAQYRDAELDAVVGLGGGSVLDGAKAIAGLQPHGNSVMDHLEGVGPERPYEGPSLPFIAVPTTAGTGSEATKNAVLSRQGPDGFKKSFRDEQLVPAYALVDPDLLATCPPAQIAANGMDAFTQLLESYVSLRANPFTDALARSGMEAVRDGLLDWYERGPDAAAAHAAMAYGSLLSGICLAQTGLGSVHGLASPLGAFFPIPHGVVCGTLVATATRINIEVLLQREPDNPALNKYAEAGRLLCGPCENDHRAQDALVERLQEWTERMALQRLGGYGVTPDDIARVVANSRGSSMKTNPIVLTDEEIEQVVRARL